MNTVLDEAKSVAKRCSVNNEIVKTVIPLVVINFRCFVYNFKLIYASDRV